MAPTIVIAAGGTGGHLFPGIAVADELRRRDPDARIVFVGTYRGLENKLVPQSGHALERLPILPLNGVGVARAVLGLLVLPWGLLRALVLLLRLRPSAVLGVGGYAGGPVVLVAALLGVRSVILEPNAKPGFTNRVLRPFVTAAACAYEEARAYYGARGVLTGNPVRRDVAPRPAGPRRRPFGLLVFGGSQGSRVLNDAMVAAIPHWPAAETLRIVHQTGEGMRDAVAAAYHAAGRPAEVVAFLDDMPRRLMEADIVVSRAGATTCAELTAAGKAAVLVPFAAAADDHQRINAAALARGGAALVLEEKDLSGPALASAVRSLLEDEDGLGRMEQAAARLGRPGAAARVADLVLGAPRGVTSV
jgi:UDP-N-acetylglucosamine--N-acetylmuramyl-(pentapeptide) pyrophosphoryl-undecaprenol N-acetylglucosamine transferase